MAEHPYIETHMAVQMEEPVESNKRIHKLEKWEQEVNKARNDNAKVEDFIDKIDDATVKEIFILRYVEGKKGFRYCKGCGLYSWESITNNIEKNSKINQINAINKIDML